MGLGSWEGQGGVSGYPAQSSKPRAPREAAPHMLSQRSKIFAPTEPPSPSLGLRFVPFGERRPGKAAELSPWPGSRCPGSLVVPGLFSGRLGYAAAPPGERTPSRRRLPSSGAVPSYGLGRLGRALAASPTPRPHRGAVQRPGAQVQAAAQHRLPPTRPLAAARARLHLWPAPPGAADDLRAGPGPPSATPLDRERP